MRPVLLTFMLTIALLTGCQSPSAGHAFANPGRSTVLNAPLWTNQQAWYVDRNDYKKSVLAGYELLRHSQSVNQTYDRQYQHNGDVRDYYRSLTINRSSIRTSN